MNVLPAVRTNCGARHVGRAPRTGRWGQGRTGQMVDRVVESPSPIRSSAGKEQSMNYNARLRQCLCPSLHRLSGRCVSGGGRAYGSMWRHRRLPLRAALQCRWRGFGRVFPGIPDTAQDCLRRPPCSGTAERFAGQACCLAGARLTHGQSSAAAPLIHARSGARRRLGGSLQSIATDHIECHLT